MAERYESWEYSRSFVAGRLSFNRIHRRWEETFLQDWQLVYTFSGQGMIVCGSEKFITYPGELILFRPHQPRRYEPTGKPIQWGHIWVHFQPEDSMHRLLEQLVSANRYARHPLPTPELRTKVMANLSEMCDVGASRAAYREQLACKLLETALIRCLSVVPTNERIDSRLKRAMDLLSENLDSPFDSRALAKACGLSERQMFRLFADQTHHSPRSYLERCRVERARHLLRETEMSVSEIGRQVGFESPFYFTTRFKIQIGLSPRAYRQKRASEP